MERLDGGGPVKPSRMSDENGARSLFIVIDLSRISLKLQRNPQLNYCELLSKHTKSNSKLVLAEC